MAAEQELYPLSIGVFTGQVYTNFLSSKARLLPTVIGYGLQSAKNLQQAADEFRIMVSMTTKDLLKDDHNAATFHKRYYQFADNHDLVEAYEVNVHERYQEDLTAMIQYYRGRLGVNRREDRYPLGSILEVEANFGDIQGLLVNFSKRGVAIEIERYLSKGVTGTLDLNTLDGTLEERLHAEGLLPLLAEIRWGVEIADGLFRHGVQIKNFDDFKAAKFFDLMRSHIANRVKIAS